MHYSKKKLNPLRPHLPSSPRDSASAILARELPVSVKTVLESCRTIAFRIPLAEICDGDAAAGIFLSQLLYWYQRTRDHNGFFFKTQHQWREETSLSRCTVDRIRKKLVHRGLIEHTVRGCPPRSHYRPCLPAIEKALLQFAENQQINLQSNSKLNCRDADFQRAGKHQSDLMESGKSYKEAEITGQTTTKTSALTCETRISSKPSPPEVATAEALWDDIQPALKKQIDPQSYRTWIGLLRAVAIRGRVLYVSGPTADFIYVVNKFHREIGMALLGRPVDEIGYVTRESTELPEPSPIKIAPDSVVLDAKGLIGRDRLRILPA